MTIRINEDREKLIIHAKHLKEIVRQIERYVEKYKDELTSQEASAINSAAENLNDQIYTWRNHYGWVAAQEEFDVAIGRKKEN